MNPATLFVVGPTGSGKSAVALAAAQQLEAEIINADAFQVYRGLEILTAQPSAAERAQVPHHLYGILDPAEDFDAARFATLAQAKIQDVILRGKRPLLVGGSGLYLKALTHGLADLPPVDATLRATLLAMPEAEALEKLHSLDPLAATHVNLQNPRQVQRALEICLLTGQPASQFKQAWKQQSLPPCGIRLELPREELYRRIDQRTVAMFEQGVVEEIQRLGRLSLTAQKAIGLREIRSGAPLDEILPAMQQATRRYAKRQLTWFRREPHFLPVASSAAALQQLQDVARAFCPPA